MTREEAEVYARGMTYRDAVYNVLQGKCIPYRKATLIKLYELLDRLEQDPCEDAISRQSVDEIIKKYRDEQADVMSEICLERAYGANAVGMLISNLPPRQSADERPME